MWYTQRDICSISWLACLLFSGNLMIKQMCLIESYIELIILRICITHCIWLYIFGIDILSNQCCTCKESDGNIWPLRSESYLHLNSKLLINPANYVSFSFIYKKNKQTTQTIILLVGQAGVFCVKIAGNSMVPRLFPQSPHSGLVLQIRKMGEGGGHNQ